MGCQPGNRSGLSASETDRRRRYSIRMQPRWNYARSTARPKRLASRTGAGRQGNIFSFPSREKNVLDFSSYRPGVCTSLRCLFSPARRTSGSRGSGLRCSERPLAYVNCAGLVRGRCERRARLAISMPRSRLWSLLLVLIRIELDRAGLRCREVFRVVL